MGTTTTKVDLVNAIAHKTGLTKNETESVVNCLFESIIDSLKAGKRIEIGMGGRLDSTNVTEPALSVITRVSLEHTEALGNTVEKIASEKAGIIRPGRPVITGCEGAALEVIRRVAGEKKSEVVVVGASGAANKTDFSFIERSVSLSGTQVEVSSKLGTTLLSSRLLGKYQCFNMAVADAALSKLDGQGTLKISQEAMVAGFKNAAWPGRLEVVSGGPPLLVLDGAHNVDGASALAESIPALFPDRKIFQVCGMMDDKDVEAAVAILAPLAAAFYAAPVAYHRTATAKRVADAARAAGAGGVAEFPSAKAALDAAVAAAKKENGMVLVAGSLYLVGEVKAALLPAPAFQKNKQ